jgi:hypothetical protein
MSKSPAGTPQLKLSNGRLQIVMTYGGKRKYLSLYPDIDLHSEYQIVPDRKYRWDFVHRPSKEAITSGRLRQRD